MLKPFVVVVCRWSLARSSIALICCALAAGPGLAQPASDFTAAPVPDVLVARGAEWKFFRGRAEPSGGTLDWTGLTFDDATWETGAAGFGYGDGDDATVLSDMA